MERRFQSSRAVKLPRQPFDGFGHKAVKFPADGHPTKAYDALDLTGDQRDELIFWDSQEIWIYTQASAQKN